MATKPTHEQAQLHLQVYDLRREARLRQARDWFFRNYFVETLEDSNRIAAPGTENGALVMQVLSYWEQACALLNYGLLHEDLFFETSGEFFAVWERIKPIIREGRERVGKFTIPREPGKSRGALRSVEQQPHSRCHRGHAANDEADAASTDGNGKSLS